MMRCLQALNAGKPYAEQIKPFNFLQTCHVSPLGHPDGVDPERFHLVTPYNANPRSWLEAEWIDQYTGKHFRIASPRARRALFEAIEAEFRLNNISR